MLFWFIAVKTGNGFIPSNAWYGVMGFSVIHLSVFWFFNRAPLGWFERLAVAFALLALRAVFVILGLLLFVILKPWLMMYWFRPH